MNTSCETWTDDPMTIDGYKELIRVKGTGVPDALVILYQIAAYSEKILDQVLLDEEDFNSLCDLIIEKWEGVSPQFQRSVVKEDVEAHACNLTVKTGNVWKPGEQFFPELPSFYVEYLETLQEPGSAESWDEEE